MRRSFLEELGVFNNLTTVDLLFREFYTGSDHKLTEDERHIMEGRQSLHNLAISPILVGHFGILKAPTSNWFFFAPKHKSRQAFWNPLSPFHNWCLEFT